VVTFSGSEQDRANIGKWLKRLYPSLKGRLKAINKMPGDSVPKRLLDSDTAISQDHHLGQIRVTPTTFSKVVGSSVDSLQLEVKATKTQVSLNVFAGEDSSEMRWAEFQIRR
jgi:hypothetical protein